MERVHLIVLKELSNLGVVQIIAKEQGKDGQHRCTVKDTMRSAVNGCGLDAD